MSAHVAKVSLTIAEAVGGVIAAFAFGIVMRSPLPSPIALVGAVASVIALLACLLKYVLDRQSKETAA